MSRRICLLVVAGVMLFVTPLIAQQSPEIPGLPGMSLGNFGREWNLWSDSIRLMYLEGFVAGQSNTYLAMEHDVPEERREALRLKLFTFYGSVAIRDVMTSLYSDPANTFIRYSSMVYLARDKISGKDIEAMLRRAREKDISYTRP